MAQKGQWAPIARLIQTFSQYESTPYVLSRTYAPTCAGIQPEPRLLLEQLKISLGERLLRGT